MALDVVGGRDFKGGILQTSPGPNWNTPPKTNMSPEKGTISIGNASTNDHCSGDMLVFRGVIFHSPLDFSVK